MPKKKYAGSSKFKIMIEISKHVGNPESAAVMALYESHFGLTAPILQRIGAFAVAWGVFETQLELATLVLLGERVEVGHRPSTDSIQASDLISRFRRAGAALGPEFAKACDELASAAADVLIFRNTIMHGMAIPPPAGGPKFAKNTAWFGEKRKRPFAEAQVSERLLDLAIQCTCTLYIQGAFLQIAVSSEKEDQDAIASDAIAALANARGVAYELRRETS